MSYTIKQLKEELQYGWMSDSIILVDGKDIKGLQSLENNTLFISTEPKIGMCSKCMHAVYRNPDYNGGKYITKCHQCNTMLKESMIIKL